MSVYRFLRAIVLGVILFQTLLTTWTLAGLLTYKHSYVASISLPKQKKAMAEDTFKKFNYLAGKDIVRTKGLRPIFIIEDTLPKDDIKKTVTLGKAYITPVACLIIISPEVDTYDFEQVLLHEYLHCYGYDHYDMLIPDIMNTMHTVNANQENVIKYAKSLRELIYGN